jgi:hypothetical protein
MNAWVKFVNARLDEAEAKAKKDIWAADRATSGEWETRYGENLPYSEIWADGQPIVRLGSETHQEDALLLGRFKPSTVKARAEQALRDVEAKRMILKQHIGYFGEADDEYWPVQTLSLLASPWATHEEYPGKQAAG